MKKAIIITVSIVVVIVLVVLAILSLPWCLIYFGILLSPDPPEPQFTSAEFPFSLVYSLDGETITVNDVYVCEYEGIGIDEGRGKHIKWNWYIKSTKQKYLVLLQPDCKKRIICYFDDPLYYMDDPERSWDTEEQIDPKLTLYEDYGDTTALHVLSSEEWKAYNIKLISWEFSEPIKNEFK